jgi:hypothetical protein
MVAHIYKIIYSDFAVCLENVRKLLKPLARPAGFEPATPGLEGQSGRLVSERIPGADH